MKKYLILDTVGNVISIIGIFLLFFCFAVDLDATPISELFKLVIFMGICVLIILFGQMLVHLDYFEGIVLSALVVAGAWLYRMFRKPRKALKTCYNIKSQFGTYKNTYTQCRNRYDEYVDWVCNIEAKEH